MFLKKSALRNCNTLFAGERLKPTRLQLRNDLKIDLPDVRHTILGGLAGEIHAACVHHIRVGDAAMRLSKYIAHQSATTTYNLSLATCH